MPSWPDLNERQQQYMQAIYETDQEQEADERGLLSMEIMGEGDVPSTFSCCAGIVLSVFFGYDVFA